ncbi:MAG: M20/M25/M40 family metallo-hydrolase [Planctomycetes bacterium]|nr:M20/M25/M40 family metallo-hydrolase [Planctomycetota bacterium]
MVTTGGWSGTDRPSASNRLPGLFVAHEHYALLYRLARRPAPARTRVELEVSNKFVPGPLVVHNTIGEILGKEKPDEFVVIGAHLDSWDLGQGTLDNGTGTAVVLETARLLARCGTAPKRTLRFVLFTGEEQGLHGSRAYVARHKAELPRTSACIVHDTGTGKVIGLGWFGRPALKPILEAELAMLKEVGVTQPHARGFGGSDHVPFDRAGVPGAHCLQEIAGYRFAHHTQADTLEMVREADLVQGAQVLAVSAMRIANLPKLLPREKR